MSEDLQLLSSRFGIPLAPDLSTFRFVKDKIHLVPYLFAKNRLLLPIDEQEGEVWVTRADPFDLEALE